MRQPPKTKWEDFPWGELEEKTRWFMHDEAERALNTGVIGLRFLTRMEQLGLDLPNGGKDRYGRPLSLQ